MVKNKRLHHFFNKRWNAILQNFDILCKSPDTEALHDLRLNAKKVKGVADLLKTNSKHPKHFSTKLIKPLFQETGAIRTNELNLQTFREYECQNEALASELSSIIQQGYEKLCIYRRVYESKIRKIEKQFNRSIFELKNKVVVSYYLNAINELSINFIWPVDPELLHDNRKKIKNLLYISKVLSNQLLRRMNINFKYLVHLEEDIGKWNDANTTLKLLADKQLVNNSWYDTLVKKRSELLECIKIETELFDKKVFNAPSVSLDTMT